ncbi:hypothetical protein CISIN_1g026848mg [Citrus sinensis]|uniref:Uncharacterized protein n=1 Tax=Citrus sinensis TaxID=2711 RepID=A0A067EIV7_CITSI|nr:hypothetical protein CISIN_1g026848mg [Citrus sinensis]
MAFCISNSAIWKSPNSLFGWNTGKKNSDEKPQAQPKIKYHEVDLPFSLSLVDNTFLRDNNGKIDDPITLPKIGGSGAALFDYARGGPQFGADGLLIGPPLAPVMGGFAGPDTNSGIGDLRQAKSRLGLSYAKREDGKESLFGDDSRATLEEVLVFCSPQIASLY